MSKTLRTMKSFRISVISVSKVKDKTTLHVGQIQNAITRIVYYALVVDCHDINFLFSSENNIAKKV